MKVCGHLVLIMIQSIRDALLTFDYQGNHTLMETSGNNDRHTQKKTCKSVGKLYALYLLIK